MILYHGSNIANLTTLIPHQADHEKAYIYLSTLKVVAGLYTTNPLEKPYYWFPYGFNKEGMPVYHEVYKNALKEVYQGKKGYIYTVNVNEQDLIELKGIPCARLGVSNLDTIKCETIEDIYLWLLQKEKSGEILISRFEDKTPLQIENWHNQILNYVKQKDMIKTPDCSYALFVKDKFPLVWERYEKENI